MIHFMRRLGLGFCLVILLSPLVLISFHAFFGSERFQTDGLCLTETYEDKIILDRAELGSSQTFKTCFGAVDLSFTGRIKESLPCNGRDSSLSFSHKKSLSFQFHTFLLNTQFYFLFAQTRAPPFLS